MKNAIELDTVSVSRSGQLVLNDVSVKIAAGEVYALLGGNGAGKSTVLLTLLGFLEASQGTVKVTGQDVASNTNLVRVACAYLPEAATLYQHLTAYENLGYLLSLAGVKAGKGDMDAALDRVSLRQDARGRRLENYSKGMRQKVAIALALLRDTPVLLLDEPTSGLDPVAIDEFNALVRSLADEGRTILMVTHDVYGACQVADRIGLLRTGKLVGEFERTDNSPISTNAVHTAFAQQAAAC